MEPSILGVEWPWRLDRGRGGGGDGPRGFCYMYIHGSPLAVRATSFTVSVRRGLPLVHVRVVHNSEIVRAANSIFSERAGVSTCIVEAKPIG